MTILEYQYIILGTIAVVWPAAWGLWEWYWKERKVKLSVTGYRFEYKRDKVGIIRGLDIEFIIFNYSDRPLGIAEGAIFTNCGRHRFIEIYKGDEPVAVLPHRTINLKNNLKLKDEKIKKVYLYLADNRKFTIKGKLIKRLNQQLSHIGTRYRGPSGLNKYE